MAELKAYAKNMMCLDDPSLIEIRGDYSSPRAMTLQLELRETNHERRFDISPVGSYTNTFSTLEYDDDRYGDPTEEISPEAIEIPINFDIPFELPLIPVKEEEVPRIDEIPPEDIVE